MATEKIIYANQYLDYEPGTVDQSANLQAAIDAAEGGVLIMPSNYACYVLNVNLKSNLHIKGNGIRLKAPSTSARGNKIFYTGLDAGPDTRENIVLEDIIFDISEVAAGSIQNGTLGISVDQCTNCLFTNLTSYGYDGEITYDQSTPPNQLTGPFTFMRISNSTAINISYCKAYNHDSPFIIGGSCSRIWYRECYAIGGTSEGFTTFPALEGDVREDIVYINCHAQDKATSYGFSLNGTTNARMIGCTAEGCLIGLSLSAAWGGDNNYIEYPATNAIITGCIFHNNGTGIQGAGNYCKIFGNTIDTCDSHGWVSLRTNGASNTQDEVKVTGLEFYDNTIIRIGQTNSGGNAAIWLASLQSSKVHGNRIHAQHVHSSYFMRMQNLGDYVNIFDNECRDDLHVRLEDITQFESKVYFYNNTFRTFETFAPNYAFNFNWKMYGNDFFLLSVAQTSGSPTVLVEINYAPNSENIEVNTGSTISSFGKTWKFREFTIINKGTSALTISGSAITTNSSSTIPVDGFITFYTSDGVNYKERIRG